MKKRTLKALQKSIEKWEKNTLAEKPRNLTLGWGECPLCTLFIDKDCFGCPVSAKNDKHIFCQGTPYDSVVKNHDEWVARASLRLDQTEARKKTIAAAKRELKFLKSLLPKEGE